MSSLRPQKSLMALAFLALFVLALPAQAGLIARYDFEDDSSPAALGTDTSGNGYHLTAVGALTGVAGINSGTAVNVTRNNWFSLQQQQRIPAQHEYQSG